MIVRLNRATREHFVILDTRACRDPRLSLKAKGLHTYLMSMSDAWKIRMDDLQSRLLEGREAIQAAFQELRRHGYASLVPIAGENGQKGGSEWVIFETSRNPVEPEADITGNRETQLPENPAPFKEDQKEVRSKGKKDQSPLPPEGEGELGLALEKVESQKDQQIRQLYEAYPRRIHPKPAMKAIGRALKKLPFPELKAAVEKFALLSQGKDLDFIAHPATWFNQERWLSNDQLTNKTTHGHDYSNESWLKPR